MRKYAEEREKNNHENAMKKKHTKGQRTRANEKRDRISVYMQLLCLRYI